MVTQQEIHALLKRNGIMKNSTVFLHTSMRAVGKVEGGCDGLIDGFLSFLSDGLFLVPTHTWAILSQDNPVFDVRTSLSCIGALPNCAIQRKDGVRSMHPTHSLKAFGKRANAYVQGEEKARTPCPVGGAYARLYDEDATIFLLGVGLNRNTYIHAVDEILDLPVRLAQPKRITAINEKGEEHTFLFQGHGAISSTYFGNFQTPLEKLGGLTYDTLGNAKVGVFHVRKSTEILREIWKNATHNVCGQQEEIPEEYYKNLYDNK